MLLQFIYELSVLHIENKYTRGGFLDTIYSVIMSLVNVIKQEHVGELKVYRDIK